jgi:hypothetical protein
MAILPLVFVGRVETNVNTSFLNLNLSNKPAMDDNQGKVVVFEGDIGKQAMVKSLAVSSLGQ